MKRYRFSAIKNTVKKFEGKRVLVIGDLLLDQFLWGDVSRISPEAPVPVVWVKRDEFMPGGACNVANNLADLGARVSVVGIIGGDEKGGILKSLLEERGVCTQGIILDENRPTILKTRVIAHHQQVVRIDREDISHVTGKQLAWIKKYVSENIEDFDAVIIEDYGKGVITPSLLKIVVPLARRHKKIVAIDPKENHFSYYKGATVLTPNHHEAAKAVGFKLDDEAAFEKAGAKLIKKLSAEVILLTLGEKGMMVCRRGKKPCRIPTLAQEVFDVSGAGDTVISTYVLSVISGASAVLAAHISNCAAGIVVGKVGVAVISTIELLDKLKKETSA